MTTNPPRWRREGRQRRQNAQTSNADIYQEFQEAWNLHLQAQVVQPTIAQTISQQEAWEAFQKGWADTIQSDRPPSDITLLRTIIYELLRKAGAILHSEDIHRIFSQIDTTSIGSDESEELRITNAIEAYRRLLQTQPADKKDFP